MRNYTIKENYIGHAVSDRHTQLLDKACIQIKKTIVKQNKPPPLPLYLDKLYLYLTGMKVHGDDMISPGDTQHVGHQLGRDGGAGLVLLILPGVRVARDHSCYLQ